MDNDNRMDGVPSIRLATSSSLGNRDIGLSAVYGSFQVRSQRQMTSGETVLFACPTCRRQLLFPEGCPQCEATLVRLELIIGGHVVFCSRRGCKFHRLDVSDRSRLAELMR